jgi:hypothetical protein
MSVVMIDFFIKKGIFMKKIAIVLGIALASNINNAFYGSQLIQKEYDQDCSQICFLDAADTVKDEYEYQASDEYQTNNEHDQDTIDEYDQHICDGVKPPKISTAEALIKEMLGFMFIQYITIKELTHMYCAEIKQALDTWFATFMKS